MYSYFKMTGMLKYVNYFTFCYKRADTLSKPITADASKIFLLRKYLHYAFVIAFRSSMFDRFDLREILNEMLKMLCFLLI